MEKLTSYIIYDAEKAETLNHFLKCADNSVVIPITAISKEQVKLLGNSSALFNINKNNEERNRLVNDKEIARTLSHIQCWKAIAENEQLQENDFALIAESEIQLVENFTQLAINYANKYPDYGIIKLQHDGAHRSGERLFQTGDEPYAIIYGDTNQYNYGCSLYLIRKDVAKKLTTLLNETKPYWLADQFTAFYDPKNIAQACYLLGELPQKTSQPKIENPLFSIIVPIYDVERYLTQCIESVLAQDYSNYELILVDDGSPDNSIDICVKYAKQYSNIVVIHKINGGLSDARNAGIQIARGEYLMFLDSDDYWEGTNILSDLANISKENPDLITYDLTFSYKDNKKEHYPISKDGLSGNYITDFYLLTNRNIYRPSACNKVIKRKIIIDNQLFFPKGKNHEDLDWSFNLAPYILSYAIYDSYFYTYRTKRLGSITEFVKPKNTKDLIDIVLEKLNKIENMKNSPLAKGLCEYLIKQKQFIYDSFTLLAEEHQKTYQDEFNKLKELLTNIDK